MIVLRFSMILTRPSDSDSQVVHRVVRRMAHKAVDSSWATWRQHTAELQRAARVASKGVLRILSRTLALAIGRWKDSTVDLRLQRQVNLPGDSTT
jgi:hypothetical protein